MPTLLDSLFVHYRWDDRHVIAFCVGHPHYEAVEAFISDRRGQLPLVHAVLTRHDKRQIDYVNDPAIVGAMSAAGLRAPRTVRAAAIEIEETISTAGTPRIVLRSADREGERFVLDLCATTPALPEFGGLTDPQGHAPDLLPVMWRDQSALGGPGTTLTVGGRRQELAVDPATGGTAAYYTKGFGIGIVAAADPAVPRVTSDRVSIEAVDGRPRVRAIRVGSSSETPSTLVLAFDPFLPESGEDAQDARFAIAIDEHADLVTGRVEPSRDGVVLVPEQPPWATSRAVVLAVRDFSRSRT